MVPGVKLVIALVKIPVPVPSVVILFAVVGPVVVLQQTPLSVTADPPSDVIFPPLTAEVEVMEDIGVVVNESNSAVVVITYWFP